MLNKIITIKGFNKITKANKIKKGVIIEEIFVETICRPNETKKIMAKKSFNELTLDIMFRL